MILHRVLLFAGLSDVCGKAQLEVELSEQATVADLRRAAALAVPALADATFRIAVNACYAKPDDVLPSPCEIAFLPPVSGG